MTPTVILLIAAIPALAATGLWMSRKPIRVLGAYFAVLPFGSAIALPIGLPRAFSTVSSLLGVAVGVIYVRWWFRDRPVLKIPSLSVPLWIVFLAWAIATSAWSIRRGATTSSIMVLAVLIVLFVIIVITPITRDDLALLRAWVTGGGALTGLYALGLAATGKLPTTGAGLPRFEITGGGGGEGGDPNITAAALVMPIALALWEGLNPDRSRRERMFFLGAAALAGVAVLLTASRAGVLSIIIVVVVIVVSQRRGVGVILLTGLLVLPVVLLSPSTFLERASNTGTTGRTEIWRLAMTSCPDYCVAGSGYGTFAYVHETAFLETQTATGVKFRYQAHSIWVQTLIELGAVGLLLQLLALAMIAKDLLHVPAVARGGGLAGLLGTMFASTFLSQLTFKYFWLALIYGLLVVSAEKSDVTSTATLMPNRQAH